MSGAARAGLEGAYNFRDLGGLPVAGGGTTRHGLLFRSDTLQALTPDDVAVLRDRWRLRAVVDLRLAAEADEEGRGPLAHEAQVRYVNAPLEMASTEGGPPGEVLLRLYEQCLASDSLVTAVRSIAELAGQPTLFHCAAGKDRTGVVAAIVLDLVGVTPEAIVADYLASAPHMPRMVSRFMTWPRYRDHLAAMPSAVYAVQAAPIEHLLATLRRRHGATSGWAEQRGIPRPLVDRLRAALVADAV